MGIRYIVKGTASDGTDCWGYDHGKDVVFSADQAHKFTRNRDANNAATRLNIDMTPHGYAFRVERIDVPSGNHPAFVVKLEAERNDAVAELAQFREQIADLRRYLLSDKFQGPGNEWANTRDILHRIEGL